MSFSSAVSLRDLADEPRPRHIERFIDGTSFWPAVVLQNLDHQRCIIRENNAGLEHTQEPGLSLRLAERAGRIDRDIGIEALFRSQ
jgi:hypothetical protein